MTFMIVSDGKRSENDGDVMFAIPDAIASGEAVQQLALLDVRVGFHLVNYVFTSLDTGLGLEHGPVQHALDADQANTRASQNVEAEGTWKA